MKVAALLLLLLLAGCAVTHTLYPWRSLYDLDEHRPFRRPGSGIIAGEGFAKSGKGHVWLAAGVLVTCVPATKYWQEWWDRSVMTGVRMAPPDSAAQLLMRRAVADGSGRFRFEGLPPGDYLLAAPMQWQGGNFQLIYKGYIGVRATVRDSVEARVMLQPVSYQLARYNYRRLLPVPAEPAP